MALNNGMFYKGVRYAKDGRYACYCPSVASKLNVLLSGATQTLSIAAAAKNGLNPFNVSQREVYVTYPIETGGTDGQKDFAESNYFIIFCADVQQFYYYFIDYIEPVQQAIFDTEGDLTELDGANTALTFKVGITLDYWQTYFFKTRVKKGQPATLLNVMPWDNVNEVVLPSYDFMNVERTNIDSIFRNIWENKAQRFRPLKIPKVYTQGARMRFYHLIENERYSVPAVIMRINLTPESPTQNLQGGSYWVYIEREFVEWDFAKLFNGSALTFINVVTTTTGELKTAYNNSVVGLSFPEKTRYTVEEAYFLPKKLAQGILRYNNITTNTPLSLVPTNWKGGFDIAAYFMPPFCISNSVNADIEWATVVYNITIGDLINRLTSTAPEAPAAIETIKGILPYLSVGTMHNKIPAIPTINGVRPNSTANQYCEPFADYDPEQVALWVESRTTPYCFSVILTNGTEEVDITRDLALPLRAVSDVDEVNKQQQAATLNKIAQGIGLAGSAIATGAKFATGNIVGGVLSATELAGQSVGLANSIANAPDYSKQIHESVVGAKGGFNFTLGGIYLFVPATIYLSDNIISKISNTFNEEFTEIGVEIGATYRKDGDNLSINDLLNRGLSLQKTGYMQAGCVLLNMPQEAGEILERRLRMGVSFWYE